MAEYVAAIDTALKSVDAIKKYVLTPIVHQFKYLCCYKSYTERLRSQVEKLNQKRDDVQLQVVAEERKGQTIGHELQNWLKEVEKIIANNERICRATGEVQQGWCPNVKQRYCLSREANEACEAVAQLIKTVGKIRIISHPTIFEPIPPASDIKFDSRKSKEEEIMNALKDNSVHMIEVCGMGGIGKTTMVKIIEERVRKEKIFGKVVMAVVGQQPNLKNVQQEIAQGLELKFAEESISNRAKQLHASLKTTKSILIILDDVWEKINLNELGIPSPSTHEGCKIILTSRVRHVCKQMDPNAKIVTMEVLSEAEAWCLFKEKAGDSVDSYDLHEIAEKVAKKCRGLPLALVTLGSALRDKSRYSWEDALTQLQRSKIPTNIPEVLKDVYIPLKWSYDNLQSGEVRYLFLLCCLFREGYNIPIEHLVGYSFHFLTDVQNLREARNRVYACIENLKNRFLLINSNDVNNESVKMHDVIRDMAMYIASEGEHIFLVSHGLNKWPQINLHENYNCFSLEFHEIDALPERIDCPTLNVLRMHDTIKSSSRKDFCSEVIPGNFFDGMKGLKVLDIVGSKLSVPSSLVVLTNLRSLYLHGCKLDEPSIIGQLVNLEILSLKRLIIEVMPVEFGGLTKLRLLDVTDCWSLKKIEAGAISRLVQLEELLMFGCCGLESENEEEGDSPVYQYLSEVASLSNLVHLEILIPNLKDIPRDLPHWRKLTSYVVEIGDSRLVEDSRLGSKKYQKIVAFESEKVINLPEWIYVMSRDAQDIRLEGKGLSEVIRNVGLMGFQNVKELIADECTSVEYLVDAVSHGSSTSVVFPVIESLRLLRCENLKEIYYGNPLPVGSFGALREVNIGLNERLQYVFPLSTVESLSQLQKLRISYCTVMEQVFKEEGGEGLVRSIKFSKLQQLFLEYLPSLNGFCNGNIDGIQFPSLFTLEVVDSPKLTNFCPKQSSQFLFNQQVAFTNLRKLTLGGLTAATNLFDPQIPNGYISGLEYLKVKSCPSLKCIFSSPMFRGLMNLIELEIEDCNMLQEVILKEAKEVETNTREILFPQLQLISFSQLPKFSRFCHIKNDLEFPSLRQVLISECPMLETFSLGSINLPRIDNGSNPANKFLFVK